MEQMQLFYEQIANLSKGELVDMMLERANKLLSPDIRKEDGYAILRLQLEIDALNAVIKLKSLQNESQSKTDLV